MHSSVLKILLFCFLFLFIFETSSGTCLCNGMNDYGCNEANNVLPNTSVVDSSGCCTCIKKYSVYTPNVTFFEALNLCQQYGMDLASANNDAEEKAIEEAWKYWGPRGGVDFGIWLAGTRHGASQTGFVWITTGRPVIFQKWHTTQPDNYGGNENCIELVYDANGFGWNDFACEEHKIGFACQTRCCCPTKI